MAQFKRYYKIGEVCKLLDIEPHLLRYWEKEIAAIRAERSLRNQRLYSSETLEKIRQVKSLLDEGYRLEKIKQKLADRTEKKNSFNLPKLLSELKKDLQKIKTLLEC